MLFFSFVISLFWISSASQKIHQSWELAYKRGLVHVQRGDLEAAERSFQSILKNGENARAHYGLGLIYFEKSKERQAHVHFKRAVELDNTFAEAWLHLAMLRTTQKLGFYDGHEAFKKAVHSDPNVPEAWEFWIETTLSRQKSALLFDDFYDVLIIYPDNKLVYNHFIMTALKNLEEKHAADALEKLCKAYPKNTIFMRDWIRMLTFSEKHKQCLRTLQSAYFDSLCSDTFFNQWLAFNYCALTDTTSALTSYNKAFASIRDSSDAALMAEDIRFICSADEWDKLAATPIDSLPQFYHAFWRSRDPVPSTEQNERLIDHLDRLNYVNRFSRRFAEPDFSIYDPRKVRSYSDIKRLNFFAVKPKSKESIVRFYNQFYTNILLGDEINIVSKAQQHFGDNQHIDDMGIVILRCGRPDMELWSQAEDGIPECSSFIYAENSFHQQLVVHFVYVGDAGWILSSFPLCIVGRGEINQHYRTIESKLTNFVHLEEKIVATDGYSEKNKVERYVQKMQEHASPLTERIDKSITYILQNDLSSLRSNQIKLDIAALSFYGHNKSSQLDLIYQFDTAQLSFKKTKTNQVAHITKTIRFFTPSFILLDKLEQQNTIPVPLSTNTKRLKEYLGMVPLYNLSAGAYIVELEVIDTHSDKVGVARQSISIPNYNSGRLEMSDILLCSFTDESTKELKRGRVKYVPKQFSTYGCTEIITAYIELYNLSQDSTGFSTYTLDVDLKACDERAHQSKVKLLSVLGADFNTFVNDTTVTLQRALSNEVLYLKLKRDDFLPGEFELTLRVKDELSGAQVKRRTTLEVQ